MFGAISPERGKLKLKIKKRRANASDPVLKGRDPKKMVQDIISKFGSDAEEGS
jgi:hypothetical protein